MIKKFKFLVIIAVIITAFGSCQKDETTALVQEEAQNETSVMFFEEDFISSKTITIVDETGNNSIELLITSTNKDLIDYYLEVYNIGISIQEKNKNFSLIQDSESNKKVSNGEEIEFPNDCIAFEITNENLEIENAEYRLEIRKSNLKSYPYPPNDYYTFVKFDKRENGKVNYYPDDTYNDELYYKWAYTNSWLGGWHDDGYWRYLWGFDAVDSPMVLYHSLNNMGKYRLGIAMYYDDAQYFNPVSY
jgi:hypothetical protein